MPLKHDNKSFKWTVYTLDDANEMSLVTLVKPKCFFLIFTLHILLLHWNKFLWLVTGDYNNKKEKENNELHWMNKKKEVNNSD